MPDKVLITGGTGFLGRHLIAQLLVEGYHLRLLVRQPEKHPWLNDHPLEVLPGDIRNPADVIAAAAGCRFMIHAAAHFRFWGHPARFHQINVEGTRNAAEAALAHSIEKMVHISAIAVVGEPPGEGPLDEESGCRPRDIYQSTKLLAELVLLDLCREEELPAVILRPGAFYGPYGRYGFNRLFIEDPLRGIRIMINHGRHLTFPVFVPDVAAAACAALKRGAAGEIYNICDRSVSHQTVNTLVSDLLDISPERWNAPKPLMVMLAGLLEAGAQLSRREPFYPLNLRHYVFQDWQVDSSKAVAELGIEFTALKEGLRQTIAWYKTQDFRPATFRWPLG